MAKKKSLKLGASPKELIAGFEALKWPTDLAKLLEVEYKTIRWYVTRLPEEQRYLSFNIPKRGGGERLIEAPATPVKIIQFKLNQVLQAVYRPRASPRASYPNAVLFQMPSFMSASTTC